MDDLMRMGRAEGKPLVLRVSQLVGLLQEVLEENFWEVWVEGEISNFSAPVSGHYYFVLKDERAALRVVMFRPYNRTLPFVPQDGMRVLCGGRVSVYPQRGELQMVAERMEICGVGNLHQAFCQLRDRLAAEGLFAESRKRPLPALPRVVGVVTSPTGAAIRDILKVLSRRGAGLRVLLAPARVQGDEAADDLVAALGALNRDASADVIIIGRGGGSLEDLWPFNEEKVARAIVASAIPVISAVGHETDVTISDLAADLRAATPSAAAELVTKSRLELEAHLDVLGLELASRVRHVLHRGRERLAALTRALNAPVEKLRWYQQRCANLETLLITRLRQAFAGREAHLAALSGQLEALSPLGTLARGFAAVTRFPKGDPVRSVEQLSEGERLVIRFVDGEARVVTEAVKCHGISDMGKQKN